MGTMATVCVRDPRAVRSPFLTRRPLVACRYATARPTPGAMEAFREALEAQGLRVEDLTRGTHAALDETPEEAVAALAAAFEVCGFSECGY